MIFAGLMSKWRNTKEIYFCREFVSLSIFSNQSEGGTNRQPESYTKSDLVKVKPREKSNRKTYCEPDRIARSTSARHRYSTVTDFARFLGWSTSQPRRTAM